MAIIVLFVVVISQPSKECLRRSSAISRHKILIPSYVVLASKLNDDDDVAWRKRWQENETKR